MKIKLGQLEPMIISLQSLMQEKFKLKTSWAITELYEELEKQYKRYVDKRKTLVDEYALKDENGEFVTENVNGNECYVWLEDKKEEAVKAVMELKEFEVEIDFEKIDLSNEEVELSAGTLLTVKEFFKI